MALSDAVQGSSLTSQPITWTDSDGTAQDLTGATITGRIESIQTGVARAIDGSLTITNEDAGQFTWVYGTADIATSGMFSVQFIATYGASGVVKSFTSLWRVRRSI